jgi:hypothetical protein
LTRLFAGSFFADFSAYGFRLMKSLDAADSMTAMITNALRSPKLLRCNRVNERQAALENHSGTV